MGANGLNQKQLRLHCLHQDVLTSTNDWAWQFIQDQQPAPDIAETYLFTANEQTAGRGTQGRQWVSPAGGGLYMSLLFSLPSLSKALPVPVVTVQAAEICLTVLKNNLPKAVAQQVVIKPLNDIYAKGKKLAGILVETRISPLRNDSASVTCWLVVGLGINTRNCCRALTDERSVALGQEAISLEELGLSAGRLDSRFHALLARRLAYALHQGLVSFTENALSCSAMA